MATRQHGMHQVHLPVAPLATGAAADDGIVWAYYFNAGDLGGVDVAQEFVLKAAIVARGAIAAVATNNASWRLSHYSAAGVLKNRMLLSNAGAGHAFVADVPQDVSAVAGDVTNPNGVTVAAGWALAIGDVIAFERISNGTGQATGGVACMLAVGNKG